MDTLQWLTKLISFNTISKNSNMQIIEAIDAWFKLHNIGLNESAYEIKLGAVLF